MSGQFPYRLVRIQHDRCNEYDGTEYVLAPLDWSDEKIDAEVRAVVDEMIADAKTITESPLKPSHTPPYAEHPNKTVAAVRDIHEAQKAAYAVWSDENRHLARSFMERLREHGFLALWDAEAKDSGYTVHAYWGHNHGLTLNYEHASF